MGGGPLRIPGGGPFMDEVLPPLPLPPPFIIGPFGPFIGPPFMGLGPGAEESLPGGAGALAGGGITSLLCWLTMFKL